MSFWLGYNTDVSRVKFEERFNEENMRLLFLKNLRQENGCLAEFQRGLFSRDYPFELFHLTVEKTGAQTHKGVCIVT